MSKLKTEVALAVAHGLTAVTEIAHGINFVVPFVWMILVAFFIWEGRRESVKKDVLEKSGLSVLPAGEPERFATVVGW